MKEKGDMYAGKVSMRFMIISDSDINPNTPSFKFSRSNGECNAMGGIGVMLGLVFVS